MFPIIEVKPEWALDDEPMGSKSKFWVERPDDSLPWLFKFSRINEGIETGEHWSEKLAAECADLFGVPQARVELALLAQRRWPQFVAPWLKRLGQVGFDRIAASLDAVPSECMSEEHRWFVRELLRYSCSKLARL